MNYWVAVYRFSWGLLLLVLLTGVVCIFVPKCHRIKEYQRRKEAQVETKAEWQRKIRDVQGHRRDFDSDPEAVESAARDVGMIRPDETKYIVTNAAPENM